MKTAHELFELWCELTIREKHEFSRLIRGHEKFCQRLDAVADFINSGKAEGMKPEQVLKAIK